MRSIASCSFETCSVTESPYGYPPSSIADTIFLIIHTGALIASLIHTFYLADTRKWLAFTIPVSFTCVLEIVGYGVRIGSSSDPWNVNLYATSTTFIILAPAFMSAGLYLTIPEAIKVLGVEHSPIDVARYPRLIWMDIVGFILQLVGIVISFSDLSVNTGLGPHVKTGSPIIAVGVALQAISLLIFLFLFSVVLFHAAMAHSQFGYTTFHPQHGFVPMAHRFKFFVAMVLVSTMCLIGRDLYQVTILAEGLDSWNAKNQALFAGLDGLLVAEAVVGLVIAHPVRFLRDGIEKRQRSGSATPMIEGNRASQFGVVRPVRRDLAPWSS